MKLNKKFWQHERFKDLQHQEMWVLLCITQVSTFSKCGFATPFYKELRQMARMQDSELNQILNALASKDIISVDLDEDLVYLPWFPGSKKPDNVNIAKRMAQDLWQVTESKFFAAIFENFKKILKAFGMLTEIMAYLRKKLFFVQNNIEDNCPINSPGTVSETVYETVSYTVCETTTLTLSISAKSANLADLPDSETVSKPSAEPFPAASTSTSKGSKLTGGSNQGMVKNDESKYRLGMMIDESAQSMPAGNECSSNDYTEADFMQQYQECTGAGPDNQETQRMHAFAMSAGQVHKIYLRDGTTYTVNQDDMDQLQRMFPAVDIEREVSGIGRRLYKKQPAQRPERHGVFNYLQRSIANAMRQGWAKFRKGANLYMPGAQRQADCQKPAQGTTVTANLPQEIINSQANLRHMQDMAKDMENRKNARYSTMRKADPGMAFGF